MPTVCRKPGTPSSKKTSPSSGSTDTRDTSFRNGPTNMLSTDPPYPPLPPAHPRLGTLSAMLPPNKVWTRDLIRTHSHEHFHPFSWSPLKYRRFAWQKWLLGLQSRLGYSHYATFWKDDPPTSHCPHCAHPPQPQRSRHTSVLLPHTPPCHPCHRVGRLLDRARPGAELEGRRCATRSQNSWASGGSTHAVSHPALVPGRLQSSVIGTYQVIDAVRQVLSSTVPPCPTHTTRWIGDPLTSRLTAIPAPQANAADTDDAIGRLLNFHLIEAPLASGHVRTLHRPS